ncbi:glycosyltransferase [Facklamia sp. P13064]|uniref:glycosyltransferase n=1 Tax=Facklamia sp. P13064 TaxID=3421953 RepID=UPI003D1828AA
MIKNKKVLMVKNGIFKDGGVETFIKNLYPFLLKEGYKIDFLVFDNSDNISKQNIDYFKDFGSSFYYIPLKSSGILNYFISMFKFLKKNNYDIIHDHSGIGSLTNLILFKLFTKSKYIVHSHGSSLQIKNLNLIKKKLLKNYYSFSKSIISNFSDKRLACSWSAGNYAFNDNFTVLYNATNIDKFQFNENDRITLRSELNIKEKDFVFLFIARFDKNKNQIFFVEVFNRLKKSNSEYNYKLIFIGDGEQKVIIKNRLKELGLVDEVIFISSTKMIHKFYSASDLLVLTSHSEGFPLVLIESQANGLNSLVSKNITNEVNINGNVQFLPLDNINLWVNTIKMDTKINGDSRKQISKNIIQFDSSEVSQKLNYIYSRLGKDD